jgi:hypothetical protein
MGGAMAKKLRKAAGVGDEEAALPLLAKSL